MVKRQSDENNSDSSSSSGTDLSSSDVSVSSDSTRRRRKRRRRERSESDCSSSDDESSRRRTRKRRLKHKRDKERSGSGGKKKRESKSSSSRKSKKARKHHHHQQDDQEDDANKGASQACKLQVTMEAREQEKYLIYQNAELAKARLNGELREVQAQQAKLQDMYGTIDWRARKKLRLEKKKLERSVAAGKKLAQIEEEESARMDAFRIAVSLFFLLTSATAVFGLIQSSFFICVFLIWLHGSWACRPLKLNVKLNGELKQLELSLAKNLQTLPRPSLPRRTSSVLNFLVDSGCRRAFQTLMYTTAAEAKFDYKN